MNNRERRKLNDDWWEGNTAGKFEMMPPLYLPGVPADLVVCERCNVSVWLGDLELETMNPGLFERGIEGIYCPNCDQLLFVPETWEEHLDLRELAPQQQQAAPANARSTKRRRRNA